MRIGLQGLREGGGVVLKERDYLEDLGVGRSLILKDHREMGWEQVTGACESGNKPSVYIQCGEFLQYPKNFYLTQKECATRSYFMLVTSLYKLNVCCLMSLKKPEVNFM